MRPSPAVRLAICLLALPASPALAGGGGHVFHDPFVIDPRTPLEIGGPVFVPATSEAYVPVVFDGQFDLVIPDFTNLLEPPVRLVDILPPSASAFAIGPAWEILAPNHYVGGSFVDADFDLMWWRCPPPCASVTTHPVNTAQTWVDSQSAAVGPDFLAGGLNYGTGAYQVFYSPDGGVSWSPFRTLAPAGGIYASFDGGERVGFVVDPAATNRNTAINCIFYELLVSGGTATQKRLNCATGTTPAFDLLVATDVPNTARVFDKFIENLCRFRRAPVPAPPIVACAFNSRQSVASWLLSYDLVGGTLGLEPLGGVPAGNQIFGYGLSPFDEFIQILSASGNGAPAHAWTSSDYWNTLLHQGGPAMVPGPVATIDFAPPAASGFRNRMVAAFYQQYLGPPPATGTFVSVREIPRFYDGFESGNTLRWSGVHP